MTNPHVTCEIERGVVKSVTVVPTEGGDPVTYTPVPRGIYLLSWFRHLPSGEITDPIAAFTTLEAAQAWADRPRTLEAAWEHFGEDDDILLHGCESWQRQLAEHTWQSIDLLQLDPTAE